MLFLCSSEPRMLRYGGPLTQNPPIKCSPTEARYTQAAALYPLMAGHVEAARLQGRLCGRGDSGLRAQGCVRSAVESNSRLVAGSRVLFLARNVVPDEVRSRYLNRTAVFYRHLRQIQSRQRLADLFIFESICTLLQLDPCIMALSP